MGKADARKMSIMNVRIISNGNGLPEFFDIEKIKSKWMESKTCQLCDIKFTLRNGKHHWRRCGRWIWSKCSTQERPLSRRDPKKYKVWDRCDLKLDNVQFENTYKGILRAEADIIDMHDQKKREFEKQIKEAEAQIYKQGIINSENDEKRKADKTEYEEKTENAKSELTFLVRSKNLVTKNIKNADERIEELKRALDKLRTDKYTLTLRRQNLKSEVEDLEDKVRNVDPDFVKNLDREGKN